MPKISPFLATTSRSLLLLDGGSGAGYRVDRGRGLYYGITAASGSIYVAARNRLVSSTTPSEHDRGDILVFDERLTNTAVLSAPFALRDMHQILSHEGKLWITCAFDNMIATFDTCRWAKWFPCGRPVDKPADKNHFNSLSIFGNELCVVAHNLGASELLFFDLQGHNLTRTVSLGRSAHNAWMHGTELMTCSSDEGCLLGVHGTRIETGAFPRGIVYISGEIYVGISERAERTERDFSSASIRVFDSNWQASRLIELPGEGMILDMMAVSPTIWRNALEYHAWERIDFAVAPMQPGSQEATP